MSHALPFFSPVVRVAPDAYSDSLARLLSRREVKQKARTYVRAGISVRASFGLLDSEYDVVAGSRKVVERLIDAGFDVPVRSSGYNDDGQLR